MEINKKVILSRFKLLVVLWLLITSFITINSAWSYSEIEVEVRGSVVLETVAPVERVVLAADELARLKVISSTEILIFGKEAGQTTLHVWSEEGRHQYNLRVRRDLERRERDFLRMIEEVEEGMELREISPRHRGISEFEDYVDELLQDDGEILLADAEARKIFVYGPTELLDKIEKITDELDVPDRDELFSRRLELEHRPATEIIDKVKEMLSGDGEVIMDEETNTLLIADKMDRVERLEDYVTSIDVETVAQVRIEARFVEMTDEAERRIGVDWDYNGVVSGEDAGIGFGDGGLRLGIGDVEPDELRLAMQFLETEDLINLISSPTVMTRNQRKAELEVISEQSYTADVEVVETDQTTRTTPIMESVQDGITLEATPLIGGDGLIYLNVKPEMKIATLNRVADIEEYPVYTSEVDRRRVDLDVALRDGQTLVIGGLDRELESAAEHRVPILGSIPFLGPALFRYEEDSQQVERLTIFLTAEIVDLDPEELEEEELPDDYEPLEDTPVIDAGDLPEEAEL